jgi:hypothetical protein
VQSRSRSQPLHFVTSVPRPLERRILKWRAAGSNHAEIGRRFHRSADNVARVEQLAHYKLGLN